MLYRILSSLLNSIRRGETWWVVYKLVSTAGSVLLFPAFMLFLDAIGPEKSNWAVIWTCVGCLVLGFCKNTGDLVYDMLLGHVETDYFHFVEPTGKASASRSNSDSILTRR